MISLPAKSRHAAVRAVAIGLWLASLDEPAACARAETLGAALAGFLTKLDPEHFIHPDKVDPEEVLRAVADAPDIGAFVAGFRPAQDEYRRLRAALADLRAAAAAGWPRAADG